jgi:hypothetical protein
MNAVSSQISVGRVLPNGSTASLATWTPSNLAPGPFWQSFEQFRVSGSTALESILPGTVATLHSKSSLFRILREEDFQRLVGLASEVHRLKTGVTFVLKAAKVLVKHKDQESMELLLHSAMMLNESRVLPEREGHDQFEITAEDVAASTTSDEIDLNTIPRPSL